MDVHAAVAVAAGKPLELTTVQLDGPREGEVLVEIKLLASATPMNSRSPAPIPKDCSRRSSAMRAPASWSMSAVA
jgi:hypothetical protein